MATHSSILAWEILWAEEPGGLQSFMSQRVGYNLVSVYAHYSIKTYMEKNLKRVAVCIYITDSLYCIAQTNTTL